MGVNGIYGLSGSGLDVESLVKVGMLSQQAKYDKIEKQKTRYELEKEALAEIYTDLNTFKFSTLSDYKMQSNMSAMQATSSDTSIVSATANGAAVAMTHTVEVTSLSSNAYLLSNSAITRANEDAPESIRLKDNVFQSIKDNGDGTYTYKLAGDDTNYTVNGQDTAISFTINGGKDDLDETKAKSNTIAYTFAELYDGKSYYDLAADIGAKSTGITATYDSTTDSFSLYNGTASDEAGIKLTMAADDAGGALAATLFNNMHLAQSQNGELVEEGGVVKEYEFAAGTETGVMGTKGAVKIDGKTYGDIESNKLTVGGVTYNFLEMTAGSKVRVSVTQDTDTIIDNVKEFVEDYNKLLDKLQEKYSTSTWNYDTNSDYEPLTKTEKEKMTQQQIDDWDEKVKSGLLYHNEILGNLISAMREAIATPVSSVAGQYNSASAIGISSTSNKGHLTVDTDKLKKALAEDATCVYQIFANDQDNYYDAANDKKYDYIRKDDYKNRGIINRLYYNATTDAIKKLTDYSGVTAASTDETALGKKIGLLADRLDVLQNRMDSYQSVLYKKYDNMERMIAQMNSMYSTIFGGGAS